VPQVQNPVLLRWLQTVVIGRLDVRHLRHKVEELLAAAAPRPLAMSKDVINQP
jgi:hypothetical protein